MKGFCLSLPGLSIRDNFEAYGVVRQDYDSPFCEPEFADGSYVIDVIVGDPAYNYCHSFHAGYCKATKALRALANEYGSQEG